jgi:guanosine-3',5'-bis(diphosphate) 3'-pyrophosphohydrolase
LADTDQALLERPHEAQVQEGLEILIGLARSYEPDLDTGLLRHAFDYACQKHSMQVRRSGEPYILHPLAVATILTELRMNDTVLAAALLHDVIEDCGVTVDDLTAEFGAEIAQLVDGVTKLKLADFETRTGDLAATASLSAGASKKHGEISRSAANLRKILLAMARDLRVMIIKLADRLHNMRTLSTLPPVRQQKVAKETQQIFAPLAHRLGIWQIKWQLEDLAFKYLQPEAYAELSKKINLTREQRESTISNGIGILKGRLDEAGIAADVNGRPKHLYSIYNKMLKNNVEFTEIFDLVALRIIVPSVADCYYALGVVHDLWMPIPNQFDDYIAKPKSNGYQSLHTKVYGPNDEPLEIQIRTREMHSLADFGIAAHWQYKEGKTNDKLFDRKMSLLRQQLFDWQSDSKDASEFLRSVVDDLFTDQVFVFTPKGDVLDFPTGATPVDVAYRIHSDLGQRCVGAKVNGKIVPLTFTFSNGDIVDIISRPNANPSLDWLTFAKTSHARSKIKHYFRKQRFAQNVARGREMLQKEIERLRLDYHGLLANESLTKVRESTWSNFHTDEDLLAAIGYGDAAVGAVVQKLKALQPEKVKENPFAAIIGRKVNKTPKLQIGGDLEDIAIVRAKCCAPVPGDQVIGYMTRGKGIALHRQGCQNVIHYQHTEPNRLVEIDWQPKPPSEKPDYYLTDIKMELLDRVGLLEDVAKLFSEVRTNIQAIRTRSNLTTRTAMMQISFDALDTNHVAETMTRLSRLADVLDIHRVGPNEEPVE